ncbi:MAG TPA: glycosyltransferase family 9 protein [Geothrix sp.]|nr:glycosyltransferase family 9 protein [Geothrix sp.]
MPRFIGDAVMIAQAVAPLRTLGFDLVAWGPGNVVELFEGAEPFSATAPDPVRKPDVFVMRRLLKRHRAAGVLNLPRSLRATLAGLLAGVPLRVGWASGPTSWLPTHRLDYAKVPGHQRDRYRTLLAKAFPNLGTAPDPIFRPREASVAKARELLRPLDGARFAVLALGAMSWSKRLGDERFVDAARFLEQSGCRVVLLGAPGEDQQHGAFIKAQLPDCLDLTGQTPLSIAAAILQEARIVLGNDSALSHLGAACGAPVVVVFGPTDPSMTRPWGPWVRVVRDESLSCLVCQQGACPLEGHPCMKRMDPALITSAMGEGLVAGIPTAPIPGGRA